jgi:hypothetical protein
VNACACPSVVSKLSISGQQACRLGVLPSPLILYRLVVYFYLAVRLGDQTIDGRRQHWSHVGGRTIMLNVGDRKRFCIDVILGIWTVLEHDERTTSAVAKVRA